MSDGKKKQWDIPKDDLSLIASLDENGMFIICKPCSLYAKQVSWKRRGNEENGIAKVITRSDRPFSLDKWKYHKHRVFHEACLKKMNDPDHKHPTDNEVIKPITSFLCKAPPSTEQRQQRKQKQSTLNLLIPQSGEKKQKNDNQTAPTARCIQCNGIVPAVELFDLYYPGRNVERNFSLQCGLKVTNKYYVANDIYTVAEISGLEVFSIFSSDCNSDKGSNYNCKSTRPSQYGFRCQSCESYRRDSKKWNNLRLKMTERSKNWSVVNNILSGEEVNIFSPSLISQLHKLRCSQKYLNTKGKGMIEKLNGLITYLRVREIAYKKAEVNDPFVTKFLKFWEKNPQFRNSMMVELLNVHISRLDGKTNCKIPQRLMDFFCLLHSYDRKSALLVSGNVLGPSLRNMLQNAKRNAGMATEINFIARDKGQMKSILSKHIDHLFPEHSKEHPSIGFSLAIDAVKVAKLLQIDLKYNAVLGGVIPNHFITGALGESDDVDTTLKSRLNDENIIRADEIKVAVVCFQNTGIKSPYLILSGKPQTTNAISTFNEEISELCYSVAMDKCKNGRSIQFLSCSNDGVSCDSDFVVKTLSSFLRGDLSYVASTDINHNCKNARYQLIGLNSIVTMGVYVVDVGMLESIGIPQDLWASDGLVLSLASVKTCSTILHSEASDTETRVTLALSLYFQRVHLFAINYKGSLNCKIRVCLLWSSLIFFLHLHGVSIITKRNWIVAAIANSFLMMNQTVIHPHKTTSEPCEHTFGHARSFKREFTVRDFTQIVSKISRRFDIMYRNEFVISRNTQKGYGHDIGQGTKFKDKYHDKDMIEHTKILDGCIDGSSTAAKIIWKQLRPILNETNVKMVSFLSNVFKVRKFHLLAKEFLEGDTSDLLEILLTTMSKGEKDQFHYRTTKENKKESEGVGEELEEPDIAGDDAEESTHLTEKYVENLTTATHKMTTSNNYDEEESDNECEANRISCEDIHDCTKTVESPVSINSDTIESMFDSIVNSTSFIALEKSDVIVNSMETMFLKGRDKGAISNTERYKGLSERYMKKERKLDPFRERKLDDKKKFIQRGSIISVLFVGKGENQPPKKHFVVLGVSQKFHGKWFLCDAESGQVLFPFSTKENKYRFLARELQRCEETGVAQLKQYDQINDPREYVFRKERPYILISNPLIEIQEVLGTFKMIDN